ncbi:hypothetical protein EJ08DRAFT_658902 [Tothia fuscella]|uniref:Uncharacterized protein n=1 Tax=Tothia fuscella TaxID=1048955 RepID=A0A9P4NWF4_9PEZI|nr:hypothetical protein EJ08DRAFT_658902 [Tothia fuscella]
MQLPLSNLLPLATLFLPRILAEAVCVDGQTGITLPWASCPAGRTVGWFFCIDELHFAICETGGLACPRLVSLGTACCNDAIDYRGPPPCSARNQPGKSPAEEVPAFPPASSAPPNPPSTVSNRPSSSSPSAASPPPASSPTAAPPAPSSASSVAQSASAGTEPLTASDPPKTPAPLPSSNPPTAPPPSSSSPASASQPATSSTPSSVAPDPPKTAAPSITPTNPQSVPADTQQPTVISSVTSLNTAVPPSAPVSSASPRQTNEALVSNSPPSGTASIPPPQTSAPPSGSLPTSAPGLPSPTLGGLAPVPIGLSGPDGKSTVIMVTPVPAAPVVSSTSTLPDGKLTVLPIPPVLPTLGQPIVPASTTTSSAGPPIAIIPIPIPLPTPPPPGPPPGANPTGGGGSKGDKDGDDEKDDKKGDKKADKDDNDDDDDDDDGGGGSGGGGGGGGPPLTPIIPQRPCTTKQATLTSITCKPATSNQPKTEWPCETATTVTQDCEAENVATTNYCEISTATALTAFCTGTGTTANCTTTVTAMVTGCSPTANTTSIYAPACTMMNFNDPSSTTPYDLDLDGPEGEAGPRCERLPSPPNGLQRCDSKQDWLNAHEMVKDMLDSAIQEFCRHLPSQETGMISAMGEITTFSKQWAWKPWGTEFLPFKLDATPVLEMNIVVKPECGKNPPTGCAVNKVDETPKFVGGSIYDGNCYGFSADLSISLSGGVSIPWFKMLPQTSGEADRAMFLPNPEIFDKDEKGSHDLLELRNTIIDEAARSFCMNLPGESKPDQDKNQLEAVNANSWSTLFAVDEQRDVMQKVMGLTIEGSRSPACINSKPSVDACTKYFGMVTNQCKFTFEGADFSAGGTIFDGNCFAFQLDFRWFENELGDTQTPPLMSLPTSGDKLQAHCADRPKPVPPEKEIELLVPARNATKMVEDICGKEAQATRRTSWSFGHETNGRQPEVTFRYAVNKDYDFHKFDKTNCILAFHQILNQCQYKINDDAHELGGTLYDGSCFGILSTMVYEPMRLVRSSCLRSTFQYQSHSRRLSLLCPLPHLVYPNKGSFPEQTRYFYLGWDVWENLWGADCVRDCILDVKQSKAICIAITPCVSSRTMYEFSCTSSKTPKFSCPEKQPGSGDTNYEPIYFCNAASTCGKQKKGSLDDCLNEKDPVRWLLIDGVVPGLNQDHVSPSPKWQIPDIAHGRVDCASTRVPADKSMVQISTERQRFYEAIFEFCNRYAENRVFGPGMYRSMNKKVEKESMIALKFEVKPECQWTFKFDQYTSQLKRSLKDCPDVKDKKANLHNGGFVEDNCMKWTSAVALNYGLSMMADSIGTSLGVKPDDLQPKKSLDCTRSMSSDDEFTMKAEFSGTCTINFREVSDSRPFYDPVSFDGKYCSTQFKVLLDACESFGGSMSSPDGCMKYTMSPHAKKK